MRHFLANRTARLPARVTVAQHACYSSSFGASAPAPRNGQEDATKTEQDVNKISNRNEPVSSESTREDSKSDRKKTVADLDEELRLKMEALAGEGGSAGVEYEDGKAEGLKRGVKANMFRVI